MLKGHRTILFNVLMGALAVVGFKVSPDTANAWGSALATAWTVGAILLRQVTTGPIGQRAEATLIADGVPAALLDGLKAQLPSAADTGALTAAISSFTAAVNHPGLNPALLNTLSGVAAQALTNTIAAPLLAAPAPNSGAAPAAGLVASPSPATPVQPPLAQQPAVNPDLAAQAAQAQQ